EYRPPAPHQKVCVARGARYPVFQLHGPRSSRPGGTRMCVIRGNPARRNTMTRSITAVSLFIGIAVVVSGCATKKFVREQVGVSEAKMSDRVDTQETKLRDMSDRTGANTQAIEATGQQLKAFDTRLEEVGGVAADAKTTAADAKQQADSAANGLRDTRT